MKDRKRRRYTFVPVALMSAVLSLAACGGTVADKVAELNKQNCCLTNTLECLLPGTLTGSGGQPLPAGSQDEANACKQTYQGTYATCGSLPQCAATVQKAAEGTGGSGG
jgi:hypothetical protein